jgi:hypothetical protein
MKTSAYEVKSAFDSILLVVSIIIHVLTGFTGINWLLVVTTAILFLTTFVYFTNLNRSVRVEFKPLGNRAC